ncbi:MAG TPA: DUF262 domain-containing protein [Kribbellaceae bacterium]|nr:DUF262 domain-containing protein [Kribbellaceae bacterium]
MNLGTLLEEIGQGKVQLPDFQREWKWDDPRITSLLATITLGYPVGVIMMLETGGPDVNLAPRPLAGVNGLALSTPEQLVLDGQQRLTSLYQSLKAQLPVDTFDATGKELKRWYLIDIARALGDDGDREEAILSVSQDLKVRADFGRVVTADYTTVESQCEAGVFPLWIAFDMPKVFEWNGKYVAGDPVRVGRWNEFFERVLRNIISYTVPVIVLKKSTPKEAVCTVFEKVNTGGVPLNVFELLTATFAGDKKHHDFRLNDDWRARKERLAAKRVLRSVQNTDFLQGVALLASYARRSAHLTAGGEPAQAPGVSCKRRDILRLTLDEYLTHAGRVEAGLLWAARFLTQQHIFDADDLPYRSQLVPLAVIKAVLAKEADSHAADKRLRRWYWSGVLGELYGGATETRFARDLEQVVEWVRDDRPEPITVAEASFQESRLLTLRTRNSAAYKGIYALLMREGCMDWAYRQPMNIATFLDLSVDIHHIFPKVWCDKNGVGRAERESIVNKTALAAKTNRMIGGWSPAVYLTKKVEPAAGISAAELDAILRTHLLDPATLRAADFKAFFADRKAKLLALIGDAMGTRVVGNVGDPPATFVEVEDDPPEADDDSGSEGATMPQAEPPHAAGLDLERVFHDAMVDIYHRARREANYTATYFIQMVSELGGLAAARQLLHASAVSQGFTALWERHRLDLTMEAMIVEQQERFAPLFTDDELETARRRLSDYGYRPD